MGHSMGGGGALRAASDQPALQAAVTMGAWHTTGDWSGIRVPTMVMGAENDFIAPNDQHSQRFYTNMPNAPEKAYLRVTGTGHVNIGMETPVGGKFSLSWLKRFVDDDIRYDQFVCPTPTAGVVEYRSTCPHT
jgi:pimeloyl-ACP methyl ester carboxylesterase